MSTTIKAIDSTSIHKITSGQVVIDLQTAVKELVENSLDAGATSIGTPALSHSMSSIICLTRLCISEVRFKQYGLKSIEVLDNGCGIDPGDYDSIGKYDYVLLIIGISEVTNASVSAEASHLQTLIFC
jgi:DNA mismatch repair enzyme (predicted ATPase)